MSETIVFFDIDGTLVDDNKSIPLATKQAIDALRRNNVYIAIATGRPPFMYEEIREALDIHTFVSFNGQHVVFEGETIYENPICSEKLNALYEDSQKKNFPMVFMSNSEMRATAKNHLHVKEGLNHLKFGYPEKDKSFHLEETIFQALLFCETNDETSLENRHSDFHFLRWHPYSCDILPVGGSKAVGIDRVLEASGIDRKNSFAFGDGLNDLEMIQAVGTGVAMGNSVPQLKKVADYVTEDVEQKGIRNGLKHLNLIR